MEQYYNLLRKTYIAECDDENINPETEENLLAFEAQFVPIPSEYRWLLGGLGGCHLVDPWIFH